MFCVCGEALWDLFARDEGDGRSLGLTARIGGSPFNVAVGLARLGREALFFSGISTDRMGARLAAALEAEGVRMDLVQRVPERTTLSLVDVAEDGGPSYQFYGEGAADRALRDAPALPDAAWGLHFGSYALVSQPVGATLEALAAREAGRRLITLDPNVRLNVEPDVEVWRAAVERHAGRAGLIKVSAEDLGLLWPGVAAAEVAARWRAGGAALVIVTDGAAGSTAWGPFGEISAPGRKVEVADTVGAGDTFMAALIAGLDRRGLRDAAALAGISRGDAGALLAEATDAAAITVGRVGADLPRADEVYG
ncbi:carbohydrate kinase family protein [Rhodovulum sp. DZ06]|uniref:carbohydrate kinase family protein n=1 Tax=Rhodovulum sp. DZ06 TaxID=3425126 RepID=UPI003D34815D